MNKYMITIIMTISIIFLSYTSVSASTFTDVSEHSKYHNGITYLANENIIKGYGDTFKPDNYLTRSQASKIIWDIIQKTNNEHTFTLRKTNSFKDVNNKEWYHDSIQALYQRHIINGYTENNTFKPYNHLTRSQAAKIIATSFHINKLDNKQKYYNDVSLSDSLYPYINALYDIGIFTSSENNTFRPYDKMTRGEFAHYVYKTIKWYNSDKRVNYTKGKVQMMNVMFEKKSELSKQDMINGLLKQDNTIYYNTDDLERNDMTQFNQSVMDTDYNRHFIQTWQTFSDGRINIKYRESDKNIDIMNQAMLNKADNILSDIIKPGFNDMDKIIAVHDYIASTVTYKSNHWKDYTAYGALIDNHAACDGYTRATSLLLTKLGINNIYVVGDIKNGGLHSWNLVELNGKYYHVDTTWDSTGSHDKNNPIHTYLLVSDDRLIENRIWKKELYPDANYNFKLN